MARGLIITIIMLVLVIAITVLAYPVQPREVSSPQDRIGEHQIHVYSDKIVIEVDGASWARYQDSNSMDPVLDMGANGIELVPRNEDEIHVGDIVAYESKYVSGLTVHRVVEIGYDDEGKYFILQGDNAPRADPGKVRFDQIQYVLIGIIY